MCEEEKKIIFENIKEWIDIDNDIAKIALELKEKKKHKKILTDKLIDTMKKNKVECFNINNGSLLYKNTVSKKPLNQKTLMTCLSNYFVNDKNANIDNIVKYVLENRELQEKETIKKKIT